MSRRNVAVLGTMFGLAVAGCATQVEGDAGLDAVEVRAVLDVANDLDQAELIDVGLDADAAVAMVAYKLGDDGAGATEDDRYFDTLDTLAAVDGVEADAIDLLLDFAAAHGFMDAPSDDIETQSTDCWDWRDEELLFMQLINNARSSRGFVTLHRDIHLGKVSRRWSGIMADRDDLDHNPNAGSQITNEDYWGENVGVITNYGTIDERVHALHTAFMNSPTHKAVILGKAFRYEGVGVRYGSGKMWVTENFAGYDNPGTTLDMPQCN